jgi:LysM repeat protein
MARRSIARLIAPLALVVAGLAVVLVIATSAGNGDSGSSGTTTSSTTTKKGAPAKPKPKVYVVKAGDNLSIIAQKTGITVERIQALNPDVDPQALTVGQKLTIRP